MLPPLITLEEHFFSTAASTSPAFTTLYSEQFKHLPSLHADLTDLSHRRLASMDATGISLQIISHAPGPLTPQQCRDANDQLYTAVKANPTRFAAFAVLPVSEPKECAIELHRCITSLEFVGALIDNHTPTGTYFDDEAYDILWSTAQSLNVPIYLHPTWPTPTLTSALYTGNFPQSASASLGASGFGWHADVGLHVLRLFASGTFDRYPNLKIIIGHFGELLPSLLARISQLSPRWGPRQRAFKTVWDENIYITTSGVWSIDPLATILRNTKVERILYSVDYPFARNERGLEWVKELEGSGMVNQEVLERICFRNAEEVLGLNIQR